MAEHTRLVGVDERGNRIGEHHPRAKLSDHDVEIIRQLHEEGIASVRQIARMFGVSRGAIGDIVTFRKRAGYPAAWKRVPR